MQQYQNASQAMDINRQMQMQQMGAQTITVGTHKYDQLVKQANLCGDAVAALEKLLMVSLPQDVSGQKWVDEARAVLATAKSLG